MAIASADIYTDFQGFAKLRSEARANSPEALREVAKQFEALFTQMMLKSMRAATSEDELFHSEQGDAYQDMFDQQLAINLSQGKGMGLADMLVQQLSKGVVGEAPADEETLQINFAQRLFRGEPKPLTPQAMVQQFRSGFIAPRALAEPSDTPRTVPSGDIRSPENFVQSLWPHAQHAAQSLGVKPELLVAQAALETHWGQSVINFRDGRSSHNLFGIKADSSWQGKRVSVPTLEYVDGIAVKRNDAFRAYDSYADSFDDYVDFIRSNPRYSKALQQVHNPEHYAQALQSAGYATDPNYARKISAILNGGTLGDALLPLKNR